VAGTAIRTNQEVASIEPVKKRTSIRRDQLLAVAADLFHERGYHLTGMDDIGEAAGITGPGVYRHFRSKEEILETLATEYGTPILARATEIAQETSDPQAAIVELARHYISTVLTHPAISSVAIFEGRMLSPKTRAAIMRTERLYVEEWVHVLSRLRPDLSDGRARVMIHGVLNLGLSVSRYNSGLADDVVESLLANMVVLALQAD
jgi:AcrR family transcriptional regulator